VTKPLSVGLIGCGRLAQLGYAPAIAGAAGVELAAVADPDRERAERVAMLARDTAPAIHASAGELISSGGIDAVVIASPPAEHVWQAELAARAGLPSLVEKPPAPTGSGGARLAALDPPPWIGFNRRFMHGVGLLDRVPRDGPLEIELELRYRRDSWRPVAVTGDALADLAPHLVDLALLLTGFGPARVRAARCDPTRAELDLETARGPAAIRCAVDRPHRELAAVHSANGGGAARSRAGGPLAAVTGRVPGRAHPLVGSLRAQLERFAHAARGGDAGVLATAAEGARVMELIDEARRVSVAGAA
jgi:predicted dehydrogenase